MIEKTRLTNPQEKTNPREIVAPGIAALDPF